MAIPMRNLDDVRVLIYGIFTVWPMSKYS